MRPFRLVLRLLKKVLHGGKKFSSSVNSASPQVMINRLKAVAYGPNATPYGLSGLADGSNAAPDDSSWLPYDSLGVPDDSLRILNDLLGAADESKAVADDPRSTAQTMLRIPRGAGCGAIGRDIVRRAGKTATRRGCAGMDTFVRLFYDAM
jgi:hypothetical protein